MTGPLGSWERGPFAAASVETLTRSCTQTGPASSSFAPKSFIQLSERRVPPGTALAQMPGQEGVDMEVLVEVTAAVTGIALGVGAARLVLEGILSATFGRRV
jgi:hypothetical protein